MSSKPTCTVVLSSPLFIRNYLTTGIFEKISDFDFDFVVEKSLTEKIGNRKITGTFEAPKRYNKIHNSYFNVTTWRFRHKSKSFSYRMKRVYFYDLRPEASLYYLKRVFLILAFLKTVIFGSRLLFPLVKIIAKLLLPKAPGLELAIANSTSEIVVFPSSSFDPISSELVRLCHKYGKKSVFMIDNWDNLSSKSLLTELPDYMGVWGEQARLHAMKIQNMPADRIIKVGTPRFEVYKNSAGSSDYPFPYMTYCGCAIAFDETQGLEVLDREIESHPQIYNGLKIVYRPHPWRQPRHKEKNFRDMAFKHVVLDKQLASQVDSKGVNLEVQPDLNYYPNLLKNSLGSVCPLSTMMIENLLCLRPVLALCYDDGVHSTSPKFTRANWTHFEGIENLDGLNICEDLSSLDSDFRSFYQHCLKAKVSTSQLDYIVTFDQESYHHKLGQLLSRVKASTP